jgi:hypothetical protein
VLAPAVSCAGMGEREYICNNIDVYIPVRSPPQGQSRSRVTQRLNRIDSRLQRQFLDTQQNDGRPVGWIEFSHHDWDKSY